MIALDLSGRGPSPVALLANLLSVADLTRSSRLVLAVPHHRNGPPAVHLWSHHYPAHLPGFGLADTAAAHALSLSLFASALDDDLTSWRPDSALRWRAVAPGAAPGRQLLITQMPRGDGGYTLEIASPGLRPLSTARNRLALAVRRNDPRIAPLFRAYPVIAGLAASQLAALSSLLDDSPEPLAALDTRLATVLGILRATNTFHLRNTNGSKSNGPFLVPAASARIAGISLGILSPSPDGTPPEAWLFSPDWAPLPPGFTPAGTVELTSDPQEDGHQ
jgi:hypothetical protein